MGKIRRILWIRLSRPIITVFILVFGGAGLLLSLPFYTPVLAVTGGRIGTMLRILMEIQDFVHLGI